MATLEIEIEMFGGWPVAEVEYTFRRGYAAKIHGDPLDCYPGEPDEIELESVVLFGINIAKFLTTEQKTWIGKYIEENME